MQQQASVASLRRLDSFGRPKQAKQGRGPWFALAAAATVAGLTLLSLAQAKQTWLHAWVDSGDTSYPQSISVGLYGGMMTFLDMHEKVDQPLDPAWCGGSSDNPAPKTPWCLQVNGIKGMTLSALLLHGAAAIVFLFFIGQSPKSIRAIYAATAFVAAAAVGLSIWLWLDIKEGFCLSVLPGFRVYEDPFRCNLETGFNYMAASGPLFLLAGVAGLWSTQYTESGWAFPSSSPLGAAAQQPQPAKSGLPTLKEKGEEEEVSPGEAGGNGNGNGKGKTRPESPV